MAAPARKRLLLREVVNQAKQDDILRGLTGLGALHKNDLGAYQKDGLKIDEDIRNAVRKSTKESRDTDVPALAPRHENLLEILVFAALMEDLGREEDQAKVNNAYPAIHQAVMMQLERKEDPLFILDNGRTAAEKIDYLMDIVHLAVDDIQNPHKRNADKLASVLLEKVKQQDEEIDTRPYWGKKKPEELISMDIVGEIRRQAVGEIRKEATDDNGYHDAIESEEFQSITNEGNLAKAVALQALLSDRHPFLRIPENIERNRTLIEVIERYTEECAVRQYAGNNGLSLQDMETRTDQHDQAKYRYTDPGKISKYSERPYGAPKGYVIPKYEREHSAGDIKKTMQNAVKLAVSYISDMHDPIGSALAK